MEALYVIPAKAGIQAFEAFLASRFHRDDGDANGIFLMLTALGPTPALISLTITTFQCFALSPQIAFNRLSRPQFQR